MAKELTSFFEAQGVRIHYGYARALIRSCPLTVRGRYIRPSEAWSWWILNPEFLPFSGKEDKSAKGLTLSDTLATRRVERRA